METWESISDHCGVKNSAHKYLQSIHVCIQRKNNTLMKEDKKVLPSSSEQDRIKDEQRIDRIRKKLRQTERYLPSRVQCCRHRLCFNLPAKDKSSVPIPKQETEVIVRFSGN